MTDTATKPPPPPADLAKDGRKDGAGRRLWKQIVTSKRYELRPDELLVLEHACREADLIDELALAQRGAPMTVRGSQGQQVIHPLIAELRQHRATLNTLLKTLNLPDEGAGAETRSTAARSAAQSRWSKTG